MYFLEGAVFLGGNSLCCGLVVRLVTRTALSILFFGLVAALGASARSRAGDRVLVERALGADRLRLVLRADGARGLWRYPRLGPRRAVACGALTGAWGLWVSDVNGDGRPDLVIALKKRARHDPVVENRPHVYTLVGDRCVPLWRGTRLAGRFEALAVQGPRLWALERVGRGRRRVARYGWRGFGYAVERVLWQGRTVPARWKRYFQKARR